ncbi:MAG: SpoIIE family protein phosphatase [Acidobacteriota bacterium]|nr:SpoIIE family protein phosphatase [Acidobacteriota bacterium]
MTSGCAGMSGFVVGSTWSPDHRFRRGCLSVTENNLASLKEIAEVLNQSVDLSQALGDSLRIISGILDLRTAWIFLKKPGNDNFYLAAHEGVPSAMAPDKPFWCDGCQCNTMARKGLLTDAVNMVRCSRIEKHAGDPIGFAYHASVPLETPRERIGIFNVVSREGQFFSQSQLEMLTAVGNQMGVAIERAMILEQVRCRRVTEQRALLDLSNAMLRSPDVPTAVREVAHISRRVFNAELAILGLHDGALDGHACYEDLAVDGQELPVDNKDLCDLLHGPAGSALTRTARPIHLLLDDRGHPEHIAVFPMEEPVSEALTADIQSDERLLQFLIQQNCRSVYMAPIREPTKETVIGQLFVMHHNRPKLAELEHLAALLANQAALAIEQARLNGIRLAKQALESELSIARDIQRHFLPKESPEMEGWELATRYESARQVGGDFYDFIPFEDGDWGFVIADVAGKGVPASLVMVLARSLVRAVAYEHGKPLPTISRVNDHLLEQVTPDRFLSLFYTVLTPGTGELRYVRAGHNPPFHYHYATGEVTKLSPKGMVIGVSDLLVLEEGRVTMEPGDCLLLYTDGVTEAMDVLGMDYGEGRLISTLKKNGSQNAELIADAVKADVADFVAGAPPSDDLTLVVLKRGC